MKHIFDAIDKVHDAGEGYGASPDYYFALHLVREAIEKKSLPEPTRTQWNQPTKEK